MKLFVFTQSLSSSVVLIYNSRRACICDVIKPKRNTYSLDCEMNYSRVTASLRRRGHLGWPVWMIFRAPHMGRMWEFWKPSLLWGYGESAHGWECWRKLPLGAGSPISKGCPPSSSHFLNKIQIFLLLLLIIIFFNVFVVHRVTKSLGCAGDALPWWQLQWYVSYSSRFIYKFFVTFMMIWKWVW